MTCSPEVLSRNEELWSVYMEDRSSRDAIGVLMNEYLPLVRKVFRRISIRLPAHVEREDLLQSGLIGLFEAIERYDPSSQSGFEAFAMKRVRGAILDALRRDDSVGRCARLKLKRIKNATEELASELGRAPDEDEIAERSELDLPELHKLMEMGAPMIYLDDVVMMAGDRPVCLRDVLGSDEATPYDEASKKDMLRQLCRAFRRLADREQKVLYLYYHEFLRVKEIAQLFNLSDARISQIHSVALLKLRALIGS